MYATKVPSLVIRFLRLSSEKFKRISWSGKNSIAPAHSNTYELSLNIWRNPTDDIITSLLVAFQRCDICLLHLLAISTTRHCLILTLAFIACKKIGSHTSYGWIPRWRFLNFFKMFDVSQRYTEKKPMIWRSRVIFSKLEENTGFSASSLCFLCIASTPMYSSMNYFRAEKSDRTTFRIVMLVRSLECWYSSRRHSRSAITRTSSFFHVSIEINDLSLFHGDVHRTTLYFHCKLIYDCLHNICLHQLRTLSLPFLYHH